MTMNELIKLTLYLVGEMDAGKRVDVLSKWLQDHQPCTTLTYVAAPARPTYLVGLYAWTSKE